MIDHMKMKITGVESLKIDLKKTEPEIQWALDLVDQQDDGLKFIVVPMFPSCGDFEIISTITKERGDISQRGGERTMTMKTLRKGQEIRRQVQ